MSDANCLFCRLAAGEIAADRLHEDDEVVAFRDINPQAPVHVLLIPRRHVASALDLGESEGSLLGRLFGVAAEVAHREGVAANGFRLVTNIGQNGGQSVNHLHFHLLGGRRLSWPPG